MHYILYTIYIYIRCILDYPSAGAHAAEGPGAGLPRPEGAAQGWLHTILVLTLILILILILMLALILIQILMLILISVIYYIMLIPILILMLL